MALNTVVEILSEIKGNKLKSLKPDDKGFYKGIPVAVIGKVSRQRTLYEEPEFVDAIYNKDSLFNRLLRTDGVISEHGHPTPFGLDDKEWLGRVLWLEPKNECGTIGKAYIKEVPSVGKMVFIDIKPTGPYKEYLEEKLLDPTLNACFSLRAITDDFFDRKNNILKRKIRKLVTFDHVAAGGFEEASKRYAEAMESITVPIHTEQLLQSKVALEQFTDYELENIFNLKEIVIKDKILGKIDEKGKKVLIQDNDKK